MKKLKSISLIIIGFIFVISCKDDDSPALSQNQLLVAKKWKLYETRTVINNQPTTENLSDCESQSTLSFSDSIKYYSVLYTTSDGNCKKIETDGEYFYTNTGFARRRIIMKPSGSTETKYYYVYLLNPDSLILQDTIQKSTETEPVKLRLSIYLPE